MKHFITILLVASFLHLSAQLPRSEAHAQVAGAILVMVVAAVASSIVIWCYAKNDCSVKLRWLVLEKTYDCVTYEPVKTNRVPVGPVLMQAFPAFADDMKDTIAFYRLREISEPKMWVPLPGQEFVYTDDQIRPVLNEPSLILKESYLTR